MRDSNRVGSINVWVTLLVFYEVPTGTLQQSVRQRLEHRTISLRLNHLLPPFFLIINPSILKSRH